MNYMLNDGTPDGTVVEPVVEPVVTEVVEQPTPTKNELLRELSKEYGVNLFEPKGIEAFKEFQDSQKSELEKQQEILNSYKEKEQSWQTKELEYQSKLEASKLNINPANMDDALKLAGGDPKELANVIKKYPMFVKGATGGITIGVNETSDNNGVTGMTDAEAYRAANPNIYKNYTPTK